MESDSVFHNFLVCMELLPVLQAVLGIVIISWCFSYTCFRRYFLRIFVDFVPFGVPLGSQRVPLGAPRDHNFKQKLSKSRALVPRGSPGGFQGAKSEHFGRHLGVFWDSFLRYF